MIPPEYRGLPALSIRQPWAHFILTAGKRHENRDWSDRYPAKHFRGRFLIHAARDCTSGEFVAACQFARSATWDMILPISPCLAALNRGGIVGAATVTGWVENSDSPWAVGPGLVLDDVVPLEFTPCRGFLGFFRPSYEMRVP